MTTLARGMAGRLDYAARRGMASIYAVSVRDGYDTWRDVDGGKVRKTFYSLEGLHGYAVRYGLAIVYCE